MKKSIFAMLVALVAAGAMLFASCDKHHEVNDNPTPTAGEWVDLGLPSGLLWATCNLGASSPEEYGDYYAWAETTTKSIYEWSTYKYANDSENELTKYCTKANDGYNGFIDSLTTLLPEDDAATQVLGGGARIPTREECQELKDNTTVQRVTVNGIYGVLLTAANGNSIFLPAAGCRYLDMWTDAGYGLYWSASLDEDIPESAWGFDFDSDYLDMFSNNRFVGHSVRAVRGIAN